MSKRIPKDLLDAASRVTERWNEMTPSQREVVVITDEQLGRALVSLAQRIVVTRDIRIIGDHGGVEGD